MPNFVKILKTRKQVLLENTKKLLNLEKQFRDKQHMFNIFMENSLTKIKILIAGEISLSFQSSFFLDLTKLNKEVSNVLYYNLELYDINILKSISIKPMF